MPIMKLIFAIPFLGLTATGAYAQQRSESKPAAEKAAVTKTDEKAPQKETKEMGKQETRMQEFDINFRGQEQRTRHSIYTLGGKLTPPGKKPGEGC